MIFDNVGYFNPVTCIVLLSMQICMNVTNVKNRAIWGNLFEILLRTKVNVHGTSLMYRSDLHTIQTELIAKFDLYCVSHNILSRCQLFA